MKIKYKFTLVLSFFAILLSSCVKDRGTYDYSNVDEIDFSNYSIKVNDVATKINKEGYIVLSQNDNLAIAINSEISGNLTYSWKVNDEIPVADADGNYLPAREIATTKEFNAPFSSGPGKYVFSLSVENKDTGAKYYTKFKVSVESVSGMLVLHTGADGLGDFSALQTAEILPAYNEENLRLILNCYSGSNGGAKIVDPTRIWVRARARAGVIKYVFVGTPDNMLTVNFNTLALSSDTYKSLFLIVPSACAPMAFVDGVNNKELMISNGEIYGIDYASAQSLYGAHIGGYGKKYSKFLEIFPAPLNRHIVFNTGDKRFEMMNNFIVNSFFSSAGGDVNINDTKMDLVFCQKGNGNILNAVMKDADKLYYVKFDITKTDGVICQSKTEITSFEGISDKTKWAVSQTGDFVYYTSNNKLFIYDHKNNKVTPATVNYPTGSEIAYVKIHVDATNTTYNNALLFIGLNNGTEGKVYQYKINTLNGTLDTGSAKEFSGFGKILDMAFKN